MSVAWLGAISIKLSGSSLILFHENPGKYFVHECFTKAKIGLIFELRNTPSIASLES